MKLRKEIKGAAKQQVKGNILPIFLINLVWVVLTSVVVGGLTMLIGKKMFDALDTMIPIWEAASKAGFSEAVAESITDFISEYLGTMMLIYVVVLVATLIIGAMVEWGQVKNSNAMFKGDKATFNNGFLGFKQFGSAFGIYILKSVYMFLWALIPFVGGIIAMVKSYSYSCATFIKQEYPETSANAAITQSRNAMDGNKWRLFVQDLSFIGWFLLSILTLGILFIWTMPYFYQARYNFYQSIKETIVEEKKAIAENQI